MTDLATAARWLIGNDLCRKLHVAAADTQPAEEVAARATAVAAIATKKNLGRNYIFFRNAFVKRRNWRWCAPRAFWNFAAKIWCANGMAMEKRKRKTSAAQNGRLRVILSHSFGPITNRNLHATWRNYTGGNRGVVL